MSTTEQPRPAPFVTGTVAGVAVALIGVGLAVAPFATGYQPDGADWIDATVVGVVSGALLVVLGLAAASVTALALVEEVRSRGLAPEPRLAGEPEDLDDPPGGAGEDGAELEAVLVPLATALLEDLREDHRDDAARRRLEDDERDAASRHGDDDA